MPLSHSVEYWWVQHSLHVSFVGETFLYFLFDLSGLCCEKHRVSWQAASSLGWFLPLSFSVRKNNNATLLQQTYIPQTWVKMYGKKKKSFSEITDRFPFPFHVWIGKCWSTIKPCLKNTNPVQCYHNVWCSLLTFRIGSKHLLSNNNKKNPQWG